MSNLRAEVPRKLAPLLQPARYKGAHGGRGGGKSHFFAEQLILRCYREPTRAVCIREVQNSIRDSVRQLIVDKIAKFGLEPWFDCLETEIRSKNGSLIIFRGMQSYNAENIKSLEAYDLAWVEEAQSLSDVSLLILRPTIRKDGSEMWFSWNPRHDTDAVDKLLRGPDRPKDAVVVEINWQDNPWLSPVLRQEMVRDYEADPEMADHVWGGNYQIVSEGAYYAKLIAAAEKQGRVGHFPHDPTKPVHTSWDLGVDDATAIWFWQEDGTKATVIDYYEASGDGADDIVAAALPEIFKAPPWEERFVGWRADLALRTIGRAAPFRYGDHYFPHDIKMREWGVGGRSRVETIISLGVRGIRKGVAVNPADRIAAARRLLPMTYFNASPRVELGLKHLRRYRRKWNDALNSYTTPLHDENSHAADAFGEFAINCMIEAPLPKAEHKVTVRLPTINEMAQELDLRAANRSGRI